MHNALDVINLRKEYSGFTLQNVSFSLPTGSIMGFVGENGAGKTTTIKSILNLINYNSGEIRAFGKILDKNNARDGIGVVTDTTPYNEKWRINDVEKIASLFYRQWDKAQFNTLLGKFSLNKNMKVGELSKGMSVKLMLAVAMSHNAKLLILDEPTSGLDPVARDELCGILLDYVRPGDRSILFSTHITSDLEKVADYITCISNGRILFSSPKETLLKNNPNTTLDDIVVSASRRDNHE